MATNEASQSALAVLRPLIEASDKAAIEAYVARIPGEQLPELVASVSPMNKGLAVFVKAAEERIARDKVILFGGEWVDKKTGVVWQFKGDRTDYQVNDYPGFYEALKKAGLPKLTLDAALFKDWKRSDEQLNAIARMKHPKDPKPHVCEACNGDGCGKCDEGKVTPPGIFASIVDDFRVRIGNGWRPAHLKEKV